MAETAEPHGSSLPLRNVSLRVSQVFSACTFCKSRKIKCNGATPACGGCTKFGRQDSCSLLTDTSSRARDYPAFLHSKIEDAQRRLAQARARQNAQPSPSTDATVPTQQEPTKPQQISIIDSLINDIGALPTIACSYPSESGGLSLSSLVLATASTYQLSSVLHQTQHNEITPCLPQESTALSLAKHYFEHVYPRLPFFSIQGFWAQFKHVFSGAPAPIETADVSNQADPISFLSPSAEDLDRSSIRHGYSYFTVLLVLAISTSSLSRRADSIISMQAQRLFQNALAFRESAILPNNIVGVQSILFLIQFATLNPSLLDAWYLIGVGMRMCVDLGLHQDPRPLDSLEASLLETRRRLWWSMYSFDRSMSLGCGRPTEISDADINASLPTFRIETSATGAEIRGYLQRYRALQVQSEIYNCFNQAPSSNPDATQTAFIQLSNRLADWKEASSQLPAGALVESEWLMGRMLLLRPCRLFPNRTTEELSELWYCAIGFIELYRRLVESNAIFYVQVACEKVYWSGLMALHSFWRLRAQPGRVQSDLRVLNIWIVIKDTMSILRSLSERWEQGNILCTNFDSLTTQTLEILGQDLNIGETPDMPLGLRNLDQYTSLTAIWASGQKQHDNLNSSSQSTDELRRLVSQILP